jgi:hypothetical protein
MFSIIALILGIICAVIANGKGRSAIGWFFIGFFFGLFGLIVLLVVGNLNEAKQKEIEMENRQRRLREQLRQERIKNDQFRNHAQLRLDKHDDALGIETRNIQPLFDTKDIEQLNDSYIPLEQTGLENEQEDEPRV